MTLRNVPAFVSALDRTVDVGGTELRYDMAFGGNFYALVDAAQAGVAVDPARAGELIARGAEVMAAIDASRPAGAPGRPAHRGLPARDLPRARPRRRGRGRRDVDPSRLAGPLPVRDGTSATMAIRHARGQLAIGEPFVNQSVIGTRFTGRLVGETEVAGVPAVIPEITGRAWVTAMGQYLLDESDPFPEGFAL